MKNLKKYFVMSVVMCIMVLAMLVSNVNASGGLLLSPSDTTPTPSPSPVPTSTPTPNPTVSITSTPTPAPTSGTDLPQTGENDIYIVSSIGLIVLVIGGVAYIKSKKYSM